MLNVKLNPVGEDYPIQRHQSWLYKQLKALWTIETLDETSIQSYGRIYRNKNDIGYVPEVFVESTEADNTKYLPIRFDKDNEKAMFFYVVDDTRTYKEGTNRVKVSCIFIVNVARIKDTLAHRGDEEIRSGVRKLCALGLFELAYLGDETGFTNVFKLFNGLSNKDGEVFEDRHPIHCFKINMELTYQPSETKCLN